MSYIHLVGTQTFRQTSTEAWERLLLGSCLYLLLLLAADATMEMLGSTLFIYYADLIGIYIYGLWSDFWKQFHYNFYINNVKRPIITSATMY